MQRGEKLQRNCEGVDVANLSSCEDCGNVSRSKIKLQKHKEKYHSTSDLHDSMNVNHFEDSINSISDYNDYPEVTELDLDELVSKAAEN